MLTPLARYDFRTTQKVNIYHITPAYCEQAAAATSDQWNCQFLYYRSLYYFGRGSWRMHAATTETYQMTATIVRNLPTDGPVTEVDPSADTNTSWLWAPTGSIAPSGLWNLVLGAAYTPDSHIQPMDVVVPYHSTTPNQFMACGRWYNGDYQQTHPQKQINHMAVDLCVSNQSTAGSLVIFAAAGDDFIFGCRKSIPICYGTGLWPRGYIPNRYLTIDLDRIYFYDVQSAKNINYAENAHTIELVKKDDKYELDFPNEEWVTENVKTHFKNHFSKELFKHIHSLTPKILLVMTEPKYVKFIADKPSTLLPPEDNRHPDYVCAIEGQELKIISPVEGDPVVNAAGLKLSQWIQVVKPVVLTNPGSFTTPSRYSSTSTM